jgi:hypothetical protein
MKSTSYDGAIVEVTDLREGGDVRGSPLAVIWDLFSRTVHTTLRLASMRPSDVPCSGGLYQSQEELKRWPVARGARIMRVFFHLPETMRDMLGYKHGS